ncbi:MAG: hypothetical protein NXH94_13695 [Rhodobacteraceae bacterium]|jgi:hypothetical protein|uniref:hypothetical protein n=1 Tax=Marivita sp. TaxID=2003365 RepID=UPI003B519B95|nr:hypothetical protein [Paracoccaceae bacterium]
MITPDLIAKRFTEEFVGHRLIDNNLRGYWCEVMVAEALGEKCKLVSGGWHAWDLQIGPDNAACPERIRIQVKNSANLQTWQIGTSKRSDPSFNLTYRKKPSFFDRDSPEMPCEEQGFLCDVFVLCLHSWDDENTIASADHRDPDQWKFYICPVVGPNSSVSEQELKRLDKKVSSGSRSASLQRKPKTLEQGIRGRKPIVPVGIKDLTIELVRSSLLA